MKKNMQWFVCLILLWAGGLQAQVKTITGVVKDIEDGMPLMGVSIVVKNSNSTSKAKEITTDLDGNFEFKAKVGDVVEFSYLGYQSQQREIVGGVHKTIYFNVLMKEEKAEITFCGPSYVVKKKSAFDILKKKSAISYGDATYSNLNEVKQANFVNSLDGRIAGLHIQRSATGVGGATKATMRGARSLFGDNNVLYVVDGMPIANQSERGFGGNGRDTSEGISDLNPEDIDKVIVLQGAQASALYGASGANGVVLINTKRATDYGLKINLSSSVEFVTPLTLPMFQDSYGNAFGQYTSWGNRLPKGSSHNVRDFYKAGHIYQNAVSVSGGWYKYNRIYASLGSLQSGGIVPYSAYNRYNGYVRNVTKLLGDDLEIDLSGNYIRQYERNQVASGIAFNPIVGAYLYPRGEQFGRERYFERYDANSGYAKQYWIAGSGTANTPANLGEHIQNPYWIAYRNLRPATKDRYIFSGKVRYEIGGNFDIVARFRMDNTSSIMDDKRYASTLPVYAGVNGYYAHWKETFQQQYADVLFHYRKRVWRFDLETHLGASYEGYDTQVEGYRGNLLTANNFSRNNIGTPTAIENSLWGKRSNTAAFAMAEIGWWDKFYLTLTGRADMPSDYPYTEKKAVFSPSIGVAVLLHNLFDIDTNILRYAKLRGGYTQVANPMSYAGLGVGATSRAWTDGYMPYTYTVPTDLQLERTQSYEVGFSSVWLNRDLSLDATFYHTRTNNQLIPTLISPNHYQWEQAGAVQNQGVEVALGYQRDDLLKNTNIATKLIASTNKNKIVSLPREIANGIYTLREGGEIGDVYDTEGNKLGSTNPDWLLGWQNNITYKNFDLNFLFKARLGGIVFSDTEKYFDRYGVSEASAGRGTNDYTTFLANRTATDYRYSASNIRLQEVSLTYHFREGYIVKGLKDLSVSLIGNNLLMLYNKAPFDPEIVPSVGTYGSGYDKFMLPSIRSYGLSVKMQF